MWIEHATPDSVSGSDLSAVGLSPMSGSALGPEPASDSLPLKERVGVCTWLPHVAEHVTLDRMVMSSSPKL